jgi:hypothetical protein
MNFSRDNNLLFGFCERVTDAAVSLVSRGAGDGPLALIARTSKSTKY